MGWIQKNLIQSFVYWGNPVNNGYGGYTFDVPVEITGRIENKAEKIIDSKGAEISSHSVIFLTQDVQEGGWIFEGELSDIASSDIANPEDVPGAREIRVFKKVPNITATDYERKAFL